MKINNIAILLFIVIFNACTSNEQEKEQGNNMVRSFVPVNPNLSETGLELLDYIYSLEKEGKVLSGMHNYLGQMPKHTDTIHMITGKYPAVSGFDFGFADSTHDIDNIKYRAILIDEIKRQHEKGMIITLTYHQANPVIGEPCQFIGGVQSKLSDAEWKDLLTPGTEIYEKWKIQMDLLASYLKQLQDANIPVLFRPYHEMTGSWFWWGGRPGNDGFIALWKQLFDYYVNHHKLNNLVWVWAIDRPWPGFENFYPGDKFVDILASDIYPLDTTVVFRQEWYDSLSKFAGNKPIFIGECSKFPSPEVWKTQPRWTSFMGWSDLPKKENSEAYLKELFTSERIITLDELPEFNYKKKKE